MSPGQAIYIDDMPEPAGTLHGCLGLSSVAHGTIASIDLSAVRAAPGVVDVLTANDVPGENDITPTGRHDEPVLADGKVQFLGQPIFCRDRRDARTGAARLPAGQDRIRGTARHHRHWRARSRRRQAGHAAADAEARRCRGGDRRGAAPAEGPDAGRRPGPFLSRRPDRPGRSRRGPGRHRLFLDAASERGAAHGGACARRSLACRDGRDPAHGRRLRRQGNAGRTSSRRSRRSPPRSSAARSRSGRTATTT